jgi:predicted permease
VRFPFGRRVRRDAELDEEIRGHLDLAARDRIARGEAPEEAASAARREFGNVGQVKELTRQMWAGASLDRLLDEARHAVRALRRTPGFTLTVVLILGLGIGMASAMFTVFQHVLLQRLPVRDQDRIVELQAVGRGAAKEFPLDLVRYARFRDATRTLQGTAGIAHWRTYSDALSYGDRALVLREAVVTGNFFQLLGAAPARGRLLRSEDTRPWVAADGAVVLSYDTWRQEFGGDSAVVGRTLKDPMVGRSVTIVGVAPPGLDYPRGVQLWLAADYGGYDVVGRLAPGASAEAARSEFLSIFENDPDVIKVHGPDAFGARVNTLAQMVVGDARPALVVLSAAVLLLLLLTCMNAGNLLLVRAAQRARELAIRRALGARTGDLIRHLLAEGVLLAAAGGFLGLMLARVLLAALLQLASGTLPRADLLRLAGAPVGIAATITAVATLLFTLGPALAALRPDLASSLRSDTRSGTEGRKMRQVRRALVASQVALALIVLAGAGLLGRSFARLAGLDLGWAPQHLSVLEVSLPWRGWDAHCRAAGPLVTAADSTRNSKCVDAFSFDYHDRVMAQMRLVPGVVGVSPVTVPPFLGSSVWMTKIVPDGQPATEAESNPFFGFDAVGPEYFRTLDLSVVEGRGFTDADRDGAPRVAVITEGVARRLWPGRDVIGKRFHPPAQPDSLVTVVGLTHDLHFRELREATPMVFRPYRQVFAQGCFVVKSPVALAAVLPALRRAVVQADPGAVLTNAQSMDQLIAPQLAGPRFDALLLATFALAALALAAIGLYGIMATAVAQQTHELGVRIALGATAGRLRRMVLHEALTITMIGAVVGLVGALVGSRLLTSLLFQVRPGDPMTLATVSILLLVVALLAAYVPARRATLIDPASVLRAE